MKNWSVSGRLRMLVVMSTVLMIILAAIGWFSNTRLAQLQDEGAVVAESSATFRHMAGHGARLYRVIADTFINREFDSVAKRWSEVNAAVDQDLKALDELPQDPELRQAASEAKRTIETIRRTYADQYLPLCQRNAPSQEIAPVDDQIDKLIDRYEASLSLLAGAMVKRSKQADTDFDRAIHQTRAINLAVVIVGALLLAAAAWFVASSITGQLGLEPAAAAALAHRVAQGDLSGASALVTAPAGSLAAALHAMQEGLRGLVAEARSSAESLAAASAQISQGNSDLAARTESQASALQQTVATMDALGSSVGHSSDSAKEANQLSIGATQAAREGGAVMQRVASTMTQISSSSTRIGDIIGTIDGIAFQTNILALNAAVEAARAGEQGRGFAVVASEVRSLAQRSAQAAREIKSLVSASLEQVQAGCDLVDQAQQTVNNIVVSSERVSATVAEITAAASGQSDGVRQVGDAISQIDSATQQNAALVEQSAAASESLRQQSEGLLTAFASFQLEARS
jgi:methyl-accepting chemotaxis protein